uniref:myotubularin-related protein 10-like isoform X2 n=1 Tax=Myxine glutinosa TaxID=7769 RepID=UPI00358F7536
MGSCGLDSKLLSSESSLAAGRRVRIKMLGGAKSVRPSFISYVQSIPSETESLKQVEPILLPGEVVIAEACDVFKCNSSEENGQRLRGILICTTLKISFLPNLSLDEQQESLYKNRLLGEHDVSLTCVDQVHTVHDGKKKQLLPSSGIKFSPEVLIIHSKNFRIIKFYLENTDQNESRKLINAIVYHCHPSSLRLLFAFEFLQASSTEVYHVKGRTRESGVKRGESSMSTVQHSDQNISESPRRLGPFSNNSATTLFESPEDWEFEMTRAKSIGWRVTRVNEAFKISKSLPEFFVVSSLLRDSDVKEAAVHFQDERGPIWIWSHTSGASLIKMAKLRSDTEQIGQEQRMLSSLPMPHLGPPYVADLSKELPEPPEIQAAFLKLKHICMQDTTEGFWLGDNKWLSSLENTGWLECVWKCLRISAELAEEMTNNGHVVIRESDCRDMCCVVASLVQVLLDAQSRTIVGFQSLIQKEWVLAGHRFLDRLNHLQQLDGGEAPVFQLFLDCVWQLLQQYPETFEFGETYLTVLSDSTRIPLFGTFLFNSQFQRDTESLEMVEERYIRTDYKSARLPSVWDWSMQFGPEAQWLLRNPQFVQEKPTVTQRHLPLEAFGTLGVCRVRRLQTADLRREIWSGREWSHQQRDRGFSKEK